MSQHKLSSAPRLVRALGPVMATAVVVGTVIGSGIFKKPAVVAENVPYFGLAALVWVLCGLLVLLGALSYAEVATLWPRAGGNYVFLREAYGRLFGFLWGWMEFWVIRGASLAALATMFTASFHAVLLEVVRLRSADPGAAPGEVLGYWPQRLLTVSVIVALALVNVRGVRWGGVLQLVITAIKVGSLLAIVALPFAVALMAPSETAHRPEVNHLRPFWPSADQVGPGLLGSFASALLAVLWAYHGWMNIAPVAEEIRNPQRNISLSLLTGVAILISLYLGTNLSYALVLPQQDMSQMQETGPAMSGPGDQLPGPHDDTVAIGFSRRLLGPVGVALAAAAVMCSVFGALNGNLLVGPRLLYAMGEDGLAPRALGDVHPRYRTPAVAILVMAAWASILVLGVAALADLAGRFPATAELAQKDHFDILTNFAMFGSVTFETLAVLSIFVFRWRMPDAPRAYRCWGYPVVPALYVVLPALILGNMFVHQPLEAVSGVAFVASGILAYYLLFRRGAPGRAPAPLAGL
jgi:APA family basic amino acid/polyamine antiporter